MTTKRIRNAANANGAIEILSDGTVQITDKTTATKKVSFDIASVTAATTRTITVPNADITLADAAHAQTFAGVQTFSAVPVFSAGIGSASGTTGVFSTSITVPIVYGSTASAGNLELQSTSHGTKGIINFGAAGVFGNCSAVADWVFGLKGTGSTAFFNTPSLNSTYPSGFKVTGTYGEIDAKQSIITIGSQGVLSGGGYSSKLRFTTTLNAATTDCGNINYNGAWLLGASTTNTTHQIIGIGPQTGVAGNYQLAVADYTNTASSGVGGGISLGGIFTINSAPNLDLVSINAEKTNGTNTDYSFGLGIYTRYNGGNKVKNLHVADNGSCTFGGAAAIATLNSVHTFRGSINFKGQQSDQCVIGFNVNRNGNVAIPNMRAATANNGAGIDLMPSTSASTQVLRFVANSPADAVGTDGVIVGGFNSAGTWAFPLSSTTINTLLIGNPATGSGVFSTVAIKANANAEALSLVARTDGWGELHFRNSANTLSTAKLAVNPTNDLIVYVNNNTVVASTTTSLGAWSFGPAITAAVDGVQHVVKIGDQGATYTNTHGEIHFGNELSTTCVPTFGGSTSDVNRAGLSIVSANNDAANTTADMKFSVYTIGSADYTDKTTTKAFQWNRFATELGNVTRAGAWTLGNTGTWAVGHSINGQVTIKNSSGAALTLNRDANPASLQFQAGGVNRALLEAAATTGGLNFYNHTPALVGSFDSVGTWILGGATVTTASHVLKNSATADYVCTVTNSTNTATSHGLWVKAGGPAANALYVSTYNDGAMLLLLKSNITQIRLSNRTTANTVYYDTSNSELIYGTSSARFKDNIRNSMYGLDAVLQLQSRMFEYKADGRTDIGLIAEEVIQVVPELVGLDKDGLPEGVAYDKFVSICIKAIQELNAKIIALQNA